jgi:hypothetical protein
MSFMNLVCCFGESWHLAVLIPAHRQRVTTAPRKPSQRDRLLAGISQRNQRQTAQANVPAPTADDGSQRPALRAIRIDKQIKAIAVSIASRGRQVSHLGGGQGV